MTTSTKTFAGNYFEDFELDSVIKHGIPRTITAGDISLYTGLTGSRFVLNCADTVAKACGFEQMPVDNFLLFHIAFGKTVPEISLNAVANLGYAECQFLAPAYVGDTVAVESRVIGLKENSNGKTGIVYVHSVATNQDGTTIVEWKRWVMVHKKVPSGVTGINSEPNLKSYLEPSAKLLPPTLDFSAFKPEWSACEYLWDDYEAGEAIDHVDGMTINDSDHSLATRLYQNNAKVHFDAHAMKSAHHGQRLVYGGHIISMCRALSHNGLANGLWLAGINGGTHANPSFAGDTIYCKSQVVDKGEFEGRSDIGWVRVVTWGIKDVPGNELDACFSIDNGRKRFDKNVVLELDYTLLMPRKQ
ncbi:MaoC family dehydratase [Pleionea sp. CnH1-48]|uniref:MaoC family dehydratase n=1 Tax=Pleionea sp. CnH1-48 TaxID=2954494 RepID=UPI0020974F1F|nr:MaoC family dehydratase [Pleionea sp. CnH1-48]MCO7226765.1 MaoC family dehydratase [Pleionea sp. CnH1-48]